MLPGAVGSKSAKVGLPTRQTAKVDILGYPSIKSPVAYNQRTERYERRLTKTEDDWLDATLKEGRKWRDQAEEKEEVCGSGQRSDTDDDEMEEATAGCPRVTV